VIDFGRFNLKLIQISNTEFQIETVDNHTVLTTANKTNDGAWSIFTIGYPGDSEPEKNYLYPRDSVLEKNHLWDKDSELEKNEVCLIDAIQGSFELAILVLCRMSRKDLKEIGPLY